MAKYTDKNKRPSAALPDYTMIPHELRTLRQWVLWRFDWVEKSTVWAKVPYQPNGYRADSTNPKQWASFETCLATFEQTKGKYDGIGFVFSKDDEYVGIDLDNCVRDEEGEKLLTPFAQLAVENLPTYCELSPSLTGLHFIGRSSVLDCINTTLNNSKIELYGKDRYFTFTGITWQPEPFEITDVHKYAKEIVEVYKSKKASVSIPVDLPKHNLDIDSLLRMALSKPHVKKLFDGDMSEYGGDHSAADMALCGCFAYYTQKRGDVLDAMFRRSKLMRPKWDEMRGTTTYGERTIAEAFSVERDYMGVKKEPPAPEKSYDSRKVYRFTVDDLWDKVMDYRESGDAQGVSTGWAPMDEFYRPTKRSLHIVTGKPSSGKSTWTDALCYNLARNHNWKFTFASFETLPIERHILSLCQIHLGKSTFKFIKDQPVATDAEMEQARKDLRKWFYFLLPPDEQMDIYSILQYVDDDLRDYGISGFVLDPFTELDQTPIERGFTQTQNIKEILKALQSFTRRREIATWLIAHPTKPSGETWKDGRPTLYSIDGSANFFNKTDFGIVVHRDDDDITTVHIEKVRNDINGTRGAVEFVYDKYARKYTVVGDFDEDDFQSPVRVENIEEDIRFR